MPRLPIGALSARNATKWASCALKALKGPEQQVPGKLLHSVVT